MSTEQNDEGSDKDDTTKTTKVVLWEFLKGIIDNLNESSWEKKYKSELETVEECHNQLAARYFNVTLSAVRGLIILLTGLILVDFLVEMNSLVYGLSINLWASVFLIYPSFRGKYMIASISERVDKKAIREIEVNRMVFSNIGFILLILGFLLQIISHQIITDGLVTTNLLADYLPGWTVVPLTIIVLILSTENMA